MGNHLGSRATTAFGDWILRLESEELHLRLCVFIFILMLEPCGRALSLKGKLKFVMCPPGRYFVTKIIL